MKLEIDNNKSVLFKPETSNDWFTLGRISKNIKCNIQVDKSRLKESNKKCTVAISDILHMLSEGELK
jgi:hypothetical protein